MTLVTALSGRCFADGYYNLGAFWRGSTNNPIQLVQATSTSWAGTASVTFSNPSQAGDLVVVAAWITVPQSSDMTGINGTDNFGNQYVLTSSSQSFVDPDNGGISFAELLYAKNIRVTSTTPITVTLAFPNLGSDWQLSEVSASEYSGIDRSNPLDQVANSYGGTSSTPYAVTSGTTPTTTHAYELLVATVANNAPGAPGATVTSVGTASPYFTLLTSLPDATGTVSGNTNYAIVSTTGAYSMVENLISSESWIAFVSHDCPYRYRQRQSFGHDPGRLQLDLYFGYGQCGDLNGSVWIGQSQSGGHLGVPICVAPNQRAHHEFQ